MKNAQSFLENYSNEEDNLFPRDRVIQLLKYYGEYILRQVAEKAMIQEEIPITLYNKDDFDKFTEEGLGLSIHSGAFIRDEHWTCVNKESILELTNKL